MRHIAVTRRKNQHNESIMKYEPACNTEGGGVTTSLGHCVLNGYIAIFIRGKYDVSATMLFVDK